MSDDTSSSGSDQAYSGSETDSSSSLGTDDETYTQSSDSKGERPDTGGRHIESHVDVRSAEREAPIEITLPRLSKVHEESSSDESEPPSLPTAPLSISHSLPSRNLSTEKIIDRNRKSDTQERDDGEEIETKAEEREIEGEEDDDEPHSASYLSVPYTEDRAGTDSESEDEGSRKKKKNKTGMVETMSLRCHSCMNRFRDTCTTIWKKQRDKFRPKKVAERAEKKQEPIKTESATSRKEPVTIQPSQMPEPTPTEEEVFGHSQTEQSRRTSSDQAGAPAKLCLSSQGQSLREDLPDDEEIKEEEDDEACSASYLSVPYTEDRFPTGGDSDEEDEAKGRTGKNPVLLLCHSCMDRTRTACQTMWTKCHVMKMPKKVKRQKTKPPKTIQPIALEPMAPTAQPVSIEPLASTAPVVEEVMPPAAKSSLEELPEDEEHRGEEEEDDDEHYSASYLSVPYTEDRFPTGGDSDEEDEAKGRTGENPVLLLCHSCMDRTRTACQSMWTKCQTRSSKPRTMKKPKPAQPTTSEPTVSTAQPVTNEPLPTTAPVVEEVMPPSKKSALQDIDEKDENEGDQEEDDDDEPHSASYLSVPYTEDRHSLGDDDEIAKPRNSVLAACHSCVDRVWTHMRGLCNPNKEDRK